MRTKLTICRGEPGDKIVDVFDVYPKDQDHYVVVIEHYRKTENHGAGFYIRALLAGRNETDIEDSLPAARQTALRLVRKMAKHRRTKATLRRIVTELVERL